MSAELKGVLKGGSSLLRPSTPSEASMNSPAIPIHSIDMMESERGVQLDVYFDSKSRATPHGRWTCPQPRTPSSQCISKWRTCHQVLIVMEDAKIHATSMAEQIGSVANMVQSSRAWMKVANAGVPA